VGYNRNKDRGVQTADFYVLKHTKMTAVLLECAFITNPEEEKMLNDSRWQEGFTSAVMSAVCAHLGMQLPDLLDTAKHPVAYISHASMEQMESYAHKINPDAPYLAGMYIRIGLQEGIRGDLAFAQAVYETDYFRYTGNVKPEHNNPGGLKDAVFGSLAEGIRAHIQHLKAYANSDPLNTPLIDPGFDLVERGTASSIEDLDGKWAAPGDGYGENIMQIWMAMLKEKIIPGAYIGTVISLSMEEAKEIAEAFNLIKVYFDN
jgi:N-acetylmuramoyl-L-alanine amidase